MTIENILQLEPSLKEVIDFVKEQNKIAETKKIYWYQVWGEVKRKSFNLVGIGAKVEELQTQIAYDIFHDSLSLIATKCK